MKIPGLRSILLFASFLLFISLNTGCSKKSTSTVVNANIPLVTTTGVIINVTATTAQSGGILVNAENGTVTTSGVCYSSTNKVPTTSDTKTSDTLKATGTSLKSFTSKLTGLTANTTYYLRAYCINEAGVGYGGVLTFTTTGTGAIAATVSTFAGTGTAGYLDGSLTGAMFNNPQGVSVDASGNVYVSDSFNDLIRKLSTTGTTTTIAGNQSIGLVNGPALSAEFYAPNGQAFDAQGNLYVADFGNNVIRKITPAGVVSTYAGTGVAGYRNGAKDTANWKGTTDSLAVFNNPESVAVDAAGNVFVADRGNNVIREILTNGRTKTVAGNKVKGFIDATGAAAFFNNPTGVAVDSKGNLYVTDQGNSALRKITSAGVVTTLAGNPVQTTLLNYPSAITIDASGNLFIADEGGRIMEYNTAGVLYYLAGALNAPGNVDGDGATARFNYPQGIAVDGNGNVYVADQYNNAIRKITFSK
ncbi:NHL repeat-containing protein [Mucilaginibacter gotjawali]|uniref:Sugar lactone lactonase YvrE n=1 Tax=Mucilaginibacter gotjawali TaxID=1550579 RepID=A0A839SD43_9SPHI|nr:NHL repeat-containing protein [Mucilaginibacter gotjawali]MBB3054810.1 sugar lactone lactonase YvrE [Mucilaginibacter gotjawali]